MQNNVLLAPQVNLERFENLFIELTSNTCNLKCRHCYIQQNKKEKDFISLDFISKSFKDLENENIKMVYLTGAEPMLHPDFNAILRMSLKYAPVTIFTNAMCINEKKARFLNKVENEGKNPIIFRISIDHYDERKNDDLRGRGSFRKAMHAILSLQKYDFSPYINVTNYYNLPSDEIISGFQLVCQKMDINIDNDNILVIPYINSETFVEQNEVANCDFTNLDCAQSRTLNKNGVYCCPFLSSDHRGRMGANFKDYSKKNYLETNYCAQCLKYSQNIFVN